METCIANFESPKSRIALQVARKTTSWDRAFSYLEYFYMLSTMIKFRVISLIFYLLWLKKSGSTRIGHNVCSILKVQECNIIFILLQANKAMFSNPPTALLMVRATEDTVTGGSVPGETVMAMETLGTFTPFQ